MALLWSCGGGKKAAVDSRGRYERPPIKEVTEEELVGFLSSHKGVEPPVLFPRWIIPLAMIKGNGIFEYLRKRI